MLILYSREVKIITEFPLVDIIKILKLICLCQAKSSVVQLQ